MMTIAGMPGVAQGRINLNVTIAKIVFFTLSRFRHSVVLRKG